MTKALIKLNSNRSETNFFVHLCDILTNGTYRMFWPNLSAPIIALLCLMVRAFAVQFLFLICLTYLNVFHILESRGCSHFYYFSFVRSTTPSLIISPFLWSLLPISKTIGGSSLFSEIKVSVRLTSVFSLGTSLQEIWGMWEGSSKSVQVEIARQKLNE